MNSWVSVLDIDNTNKLTEFVNLISSLESSDPNTWIKWHSCVDNQTVIKTNNYVYKIYCCHKNSNKVFDCIIRDTLSKIYNEYGIFWNIKTFDVGINLYQIEQREIITECTPDLISFEDLLLNWKITLDELENRLNFGNLSYQLRDYIIDNNKIKVFKRNFIGTTEYVEDTVFKIKLTRDCINKYNDYGIKNGKVILFDDADWIVCLINKFGDVLNLRYENLLKIPLKFNNNTIYLQPINVIDTIQSYMLFNDTFHNKFNLLYLQECNQSLENINIRQLKDDMIINNIKLLTTGVKSNNEMSLLDDSNIMKNLKTNNGHLSSIIYQEGI